jgi:hypothetical protein
MHLIIGTRGAKHDVDRFITELQGKYFPYKTDKGNYAVAMNVQPIQLWSLVFPESSLHTVLKTFEMKPWTKGFNRIVSLGRKLLGLKEIPKIDEKASPLPIYKSNIEIMPFGIIEDLKFTSGELKGGEAL